MFLTVEQAAELLHCNVDTVRRLAAANKIPARKVTACTVRRCALYPVRPVSRGSAVPSGADLPPEQTAGGQP